MQVRALVALLALTMAITLGVSMRDDTQAPVIDAASGAPQAAAPPAAPTRPAKAGATADAASRSVKSRGKAGSANCRKLKCVALTFDDGPGLDTQRLLQVLQRRNARATFFLVGTMVQARPKVTRRIAAAGHEVGVHTMGHPDLTRLSDRWVLWQLRQTKKLIRRATGSTPALSRPPYGATDRRVLRLQGELGLSEILWDVDTSDWKVRNARHVASTAVRQARRNSVILTHDIRPTTVDAVDSMIRGLRRRGFTLVTVSELIGDPKPGRTYFDWRRPAAKEAVTTAGKRKKTNAPRTARSRKGRTGAH